MQQGDFSPSYYHHLQNPNDHHPNSLPTTYASDPPFFPNYSQNPDPVNNLSPTAPSLHQDLNFQTSNPSSLLPSFSAVHEPPTPNQQPQYYALYDKNSSFSAPYSAPESMPPNPNPNSNQNSSFSAPYSYDSSAPPFYESPYESSMKFDHRGGYLDETSSRYGNQGVYGRNQSDLVSDFYEKRPESGIRYDDVGFGQGVYAYDGGKVEPYSGRGNGSKSSNLLAFDDYGRPTSFSSGKDQVNSGKIVRAIPKEETQQDVKNGVQKFRVKLLAEGGSQSPMDVLCQIGLDGIRVLDSNTSRILRIYPLETLTKWEATGSSIFTFWSKSVVDVEPRCIRLQSNSYTTNTILDTVTAATVQFKEMDGKDSFRSRPSDSGKLSDQSTEKRKGIADWMTLIKPGIGNEEKDHWVPDEAANKCTACRTDFGAFVRKHHCRNCGDIFCDKCTQGRIALTTDENAQPVRVCDSCMAEVAQRLSNAKELASKPAGLHSHNDLARKLQEEMDRNRKASSGSNSSGGSGRPMREVACPTCTVHLQVQVPSSGSETIECGVCQNPFLVSAH